jgi:uncharacterized integral membrane protein (TIGR00697 family)
MNEILFLVQIFLIWGFALLALRLGKTALTTWVALQALIANLFVLKQITLFRFEVTASDVFAIGSLIGLNFLQEHFGKDEARKATWICFCSMLFFALVSQLHLLYHPSPHDTTQAAFVTILSPSLRLLIASIGVFFVVQQIDVRLFALLKKWFPAKSFALRVLAALVVSQFLDTVLFSFAGLYGMVNSIGDIILLSFAVKVIVIFCFTPLAKWAKT